MEGYDRYEYERMAGWVVCIHTHPKMHQNAMNPQPRQEFEALLDAILGCSLTSALSSLASERSVCDGLFPSSANSTGA